MPGLVGRSTWRGDRRPSLPSAQLRARRVISAGLDSPRPVMRADRSAGRAVRVFFFAHLKRAQSSAPLRFAPPAVGAARVCAGAFFTTSQVLLLACALVNHAGRFTGARSEAARRNWEDDRAETRASTALVDFPPAVNVMLFFFVSYERERGRSLLPVERTRRRSANGRSRLCPPPSGALFGCRNKIAGTHAGHANEAPEIWATVWIEIHHTQSAAPETERPAEGCWRASSKASEKLLMPHSERERASDCLPLPYLRRRHLGRAEGAPVGGHLRAPAT